jgi:hypothetical protein
MMTIPKASVTKGSLSGGDYLQSWRDGAPRVEFRKTRREQNLSAASFEIYMF